MGFRVVRIYADRQSKFGDGLIELSLISEDYPISGMQAGIRFDR